MQLFFESKRTLRQSSISQHATHATHATHAQRPPSVRPASAPSKQELMDLLTLLPQQLLRLVVSFACDVGDAALFVPRSPGSAPRTMPQLVLLSREWRQIVMEMERAHSAITHTLTLQASSQDQMPALLEELAAKGDSLLELKVAMGMTRSPVGGLFIMRQELKWLQSVDSLEIDWHRVFASCKKLLRLDLIAVPLNSAHVCRILDAASSHCLSLQALELPASGIGVDEREVDPAPVMISLYQALERWRSHGAGHVGLTQLTVPKRHNFTDSNFSLQQRSDQFLTAVAQFCPNIEYLDGWKATYVDTNDLRCNEIWFCSLETWTQFCKCCANLREFNWFVAPFDRDYLEVFASFQKSNLKKMTITCGNDDYFSDYLISGEYHRPDGGFDFSSESVSRVLTACPALEELQILFNKRLYRTMWLQDRINDDFLRCVAQTCPDLKALTIDEVDIVGREQTIPNISDQGLFAITGMPRLRSITLKQTHCSVNGILALVLQNSTPEDKRRVIVKLGSTDPEHRMQFFDELTELMEIILAQPTGALANHRFQLELAVHGSRDILYKEAVRDRLVALNQDLSIQHPSIDVYFCGQTRKTKKVPMRIEKVRSMLIVARPSHHS